MNCCVFAGMLGVVLLGSMASSTAQSGAPYTITVDTIDGGGATFSAGSTYRLGDTVGQADAGMLTGANLTLTGGFWSVLIPSSSSTPTVTPPAGSTPTAIGTPTPPVCVGDCDGDATVTVDEILTMVNAALGNVAVTECSAGDGNHDGLITVDEILTTVNNALNGCGAVGSPLAYAPHFQAVSVATDGLASGGDVWNRFALASFHR